MVFEGRALDNGTDFYNTHTWTCESCLAYLKDSIQPPYDYKGTLRGLLELFVSVHNNTVEEKKRFVVGNVTVTDNNDYVSYSSIDFTVTLDAIAVFPSKTVFKKNIGICCSSPIGRYICWLLLYWSVFIPQIDTFRYQVSSTVIFLFASTSLYLTCSGFPSGSDYSSTC